MAATLIPKFALSPDQLTAVRERLDAPEHAADWRELSLPSSWERFAADRLFAYVDGLNVIGVVAIDGGDHAVDPAWWIAADARGQGHGRQMIEALADILITRGVVGIKPNIMIASGPSDPASRKLVDILRDKFGQGLSRLS